MGHDHHRHEHDKGLRTKLHWLLQIRKFWQSDVNREVFAMAAPAAGEHAVDVGAGMGPATVLAARRGARVTAVEPSRFMRTILSVRRPFQRARSRITVADGVAESLPVPDGSVDVLWTVNAVHHWVDLEAAFDSTPPTTTTSRRRRSWTSWPSRRRCGPVDSRPPVRRPRPPASPSS